MNRIFNITEEKGFYAEVSRQPPAGKFSTIRNNRFKGTTTYLKEIRGYPFQGCRSASILSPHIILMFLAMLFSTLPDFECFQASEVRKYSLWTLQPVSGWNDPWPLVQKYAFGEF
jgi:hypothetical protein